MKKRVFIAVLAMTSMLQAAESAPPAPRAMEVKFFGGFTGFDSGAYRALKASVASLISEGVIDQFVTTEWGMEGGSAFCVELNRDPKTSLEQVEKVLKSIRPSDQSLYTFSSKVSCTKNP